MLNFSCNGVVLIRLEVFVFFNCSFDIFVRSKSGCRFEQQLISNFCYIIRTLFLVASFILLCLRFSM